MNKDIINKSIFWQLLYIVIYSFCTVVINIYFPDEKSMEDNVN